MDGTRLIFPKKKGYSGEPRATRHRWWPPSGREGRRRAFAVLRTWSRLLPGVYIATRAAGDRRPAKGKPSRPGGIELDGLALPSRPPAAPRPFACHALARPARHGTASHAPTRGVDSGTTTGVVRVPMATSGRPARAPRVTLACLYPTSPPPTHQFPADRPAGTSTARRPPARRFAFAFTPAPVFRPGRLALAVRVPRSPW